GQLTRSFQKIPLAIVVPLIAGFLSLGPQAVGNAAVSSALQFASQAHTFTALPSPGAIPINIGFDKCVTTQATSLPGASTAYILDQGHQFHVGRIDARPNSAKMINGQAIRNGRVVQLIGKPVSEMLVPEIRKVSIPEIVLRSDPQ